MEIRSHLISLLLLISLPSFTSDKPPKKAVFILGAPRSGTSVTTGIMQQLGLNLGDALTEPGSWNPKGDFEDAATVDMNRKIIRSLGICPRNATTEHAIDWENDPRALQAKESIKNTITGVFGDTHIFGIKHPRVCLLLPLYLRAAEELGYQPHLVVVSRDPKDVVRSLNKSEKQKGDEYTPKEGLRFVYNFLRPIAQHAADYPHVRLTFNEVTRTPAVAIEKMRTLIPELDTFEERSEEIRKFITPQQKIKRA